MMSLLLQFTGNNQDLSAPNIPLHTIATKGAFGPGGGVNNNLNINLPENNNAILRLEVELRDKNAPKYRRAAGLPSTAAAGRGRGGGMTTRPGGNNNRAIADGRGGGGGVGGGGNVTAVMTDLKGNAIIPLEKVSRMGYMFTLIKW